MPNPTDDVVFVDTETFGLDPDLHAIWEVALIASGWEHRWVVDVAEDEIAAADPIALEMTRFHERHPQGDRFDRDAVPLGGALKAEDRSTVAGAVDLITAGKHLVGAVPSFDEERLRSMLRAEGINPTWHYHLIDVEVLAVGYLAGRSWGARANDAPEVADVGRRTLTPTVLEDVTARIGTGDAFLPWKSEDLSRAIGVDPDGFDRHTALGDARWAEAIYKRVLGL